MSASLLTDARLGQHLFHALCAQDRVELPGWGVFVVTPYGADIQLVSGLFLPPARRVAFFPDAAVAGNAFVQQVAHVEQVSLVDAGRMVHDVVRSWRVRLDQGDRISVESIGAFSMRSGFQWVFQPALEANFLPESYGLPIYRLPVVAVEGESRSLRLPVAPRQGFEAPAERANRVAAATPRKEPRFSEPKPLAASEPAASQPRIRSNREKWLAPIRSAAVFPRIVGLLVVGGTKPGFQQDLHHVLHEASWMRAPKLTWPSMDLFSQPPYEETPAPKSAKEEAPKSEAAPAEANPVAEKPALETPAPAPAVSKEEAPKPAERDKPAPVSAPAKVDAAWAKPAASQGSAEKPAASSAASKTTASSVTKQKAAAATRNDRFYLVVGAFGDQANAERMVADLRASGHSAQLVPTAMGTTKVAAAVVNSQKEAYAKRDVLKKTFSAVWVFQGNK